MVVLVVPGIVVVVDPWSVVVVVDPGSVVVVVDPGGDVVVVIEVVVVDPGGDVVVVVAAWHKGVVIVLDNSVTAAVCARARPFKLAPVPRLMAVDARIFPMNVVPEPITAELTSFHHTLQGEPIPLRN
jgi:hypothetical protein